MIPDARPLMATDRALLLDLVRDLAPDGWTAVTAAAPWRVRDVVAHVVGDDLNRLSRTRDAYAAGGPAPGEPIEAFVHRINAEWVLATARLSPVVLTDLLAATTPQVLALWNALDLDVPGEPVSWAGPGPAPVRLDCARDYTEYWVHRRQIAAATGRDAADEDPGLLAAVLATFVHAVPLTLRRLGADGSGGTLSLVVPGPSGGRWTWRAAADAAVTVDADTLWRVAVRMVEPAQARRRATIEGDRRVGAAALELVSIIR